MQIMHLDSKTFNDSTESRQVIEKVTVLAGMSYGASIEFFYPPESKDAIVSALSGAEVRIRSFGRSSLKIEAEGLFQCARIKKALDVLKSANFVSEAFVRQISENFPNGHGGVHPLNDTQMGFGHSRTYRSIMDILGSPIADISSEIESMHTSAITRRDLFSSEPRTFGFDIPALPRHDFFVHAGVRSSGGLTPEEIGRMIGVHTQTPIRTMPSTGINSEKLADLDIDIPREYCCPLSLSIMTDPVYIEGDTTGQRFEREWINTWLIDKGTHPSTRVKFKVESLKADLDLKNEIDTFVESSVAANVGLKK